MRVIKIDYCNHCPFYKTEMKEREVEGLIFTDSANDNYKGDNFITNMNGKKKYVQELICYCLEKKKGHMIPIENLGIELFVLDLKLSKKMYKEIENDYDLFLKAQNKLNDDYEKKLKVEIPGWCPLEELEKR